MTDAALGAESGCTAVPPAELRTLDGATNAAAALVVTAFLAPLMLLISLAIWLDDGGPAFFRQRRVGRGGRVFHCIKFRSMTVGADALLAERLSEDVEARAEWELLRKLRDDPRVTRVGRFLRRSSLDELPQLFNVVRGEMRLVGPRPILEEEVALYGVHFRRYCRVRPGVTGLWQVSGRSGLSFRRRVVMDVAYVRRRSVWVDLRILVGTLPAVLLQRGSC